MAPWRLVASWRRARKKGVLGVSGVGRSGEHLGDEVCFEGGVAEVVEGGAGRVLDADGGADGVQDLVVGDELATAGVDVLTRLQESAAASRAHPGHVVASVRRPVGEIVEPD